MERNTENPLPEQLGSNPEDRIWNLLTLVALLGVFCLAASFVLTFANPHNFLNPFPPGSAAIVNLATPTPLKVRPTTQAPEFTATPLPPSPAPTETPTAVALTSVPATAVAPVVETPVESTQPSANPNGYPFQLRSDPMQVSSAMSYPDQGCNWQGVGGEVFDLQNSPLVGLTILMGGSMGGKSVNLRTLTGTATQYGPAGFEFTLGETPLDSNGTLWLQLVDQADLPLSARVPLSTSSDCKQNLLLVSFKQVR